MNFKCNGVSTTILSLDEIFPIGSVYKSVNPENPSTYFKGGVWEQFGQGQTLVGVDPNDTDFNTVEKIGGEKISTELKCGATNCGFIINSAYYMERTIVRKGVVSGSSERYAQISLLQPYITVYFWKRIA